MQYKTRLREKVYIFTIILLPILCLYKAIGSFSVADVMIIIVFAMIVIRASWKISLSGSAKMLQNLSIWIVISWFLGTLLILLVYEICQNALANSFFSAVRVVVYYLFACAIASAISNWTLFMKVYRVFVLITTGVLFGQFIIHAVTGQVVLGYFTFLPLINANVDSESLIRLNTYSQYRPYSVFTEPGMYVRYVIPFIVILLFDDIGMTERVYQNKIIKVIEIVLPTIACLLSGAGQGIALICLVYACYFIMNVVTGRISGKFMVLLLVAIIGGGYYLTTDSFQAILLRIMPTDAGTNINSFGTRIIRGFLVYEQLPVLLQLVGFGYGNQDVVIRELDITTQFDQANNSGYMNAAAYTLVNTGIVGFILFIMVFLKVVLNKKNSNVARVLALVALVLSFVGGTTISIMGILYFVVIFGCKNIIKDNQG